MDLALSVMNNKQLSIATTVNSLEIRRMTHLEFLQIAIETIHL